MAEMYFNEYGIAFCERCREPADWDEEGPYCPVCPVVEIKDGETRNIKEIK